VIAAMMAAHARRPKLMINLPCGHTADPHRRRHWFPELLLQQARLRRSRN